MIKIRVKHRKDAKKYNYAIFEVKGLKNVRYVLLPGPEDKYDIRYYNSIKPGAQEFVDTAKIEEFFNSGKWIIVKYDRTFKIIQS